MACVLAALMQQEVQVKANLATGKLVEAVVGALLDHFGPGFTDIQCVGILKNTLDKFDTCTGGQVKMQCACSKAFVASWALYSKACGPSPDVFKAIAANAAKVKCVAYAKSDEL